MKLYGVSRYSFTSNGKLCILRTVVTSTPKRETKKQDEACDSAPSPGQRSVPDRNPTEGRGEANSASRISTTSFPKKGYLQ